MPFKELLSSVPGKQQRSGLQPVKLELRQGFVTKMSASVAGNMWTPAMVFATWRVLASPSSQYGHTLCCIQEQNRNKSGWGRAKALNHVSVDTVFTKLVQRCGHCSQGLQRGILHSLGQVGSAQGWKPQGEPVTPRTVMCDLFTKGLQVVGIKKHKLLMRNENHTAHVALTRFTIL